nr:hypothetical protein [Rickettsia endosymbiont of Ceutorhynchus assimilis]
MRKIINLGININKFTPQLGSSYIKLPPQIAARKACVNVPNSEQVCFAWAVVSALFPAEKDSQRLSKYPDFREVLKLKGVQFPMSINQIPNFEKQNSLSGNVYKLEKSGKTFKVLPTYLTRNKKDKHVNLLMIQDKYGDEGEDAIPVKYHYVWIKNLSRLVSKQLSKHDGKKHICDRCLHYFRSEDKLDKHQEDCAKINDTKIKMPEIGKNILRFKNYKNKERAPFIVYADLESVLAPTADSKRTQQHIPAAVGYYLKCSYDD